MNKLCLLYLLFSFYSIVVFYVFIEVPPNLSKILSNFAIQGSM